MSRSSKPDIRPEWSAQRIDAQPNPMLTAALDIVRGLAPGATVAVDQGCGKLRHLRTLAQNYHRLILVDTERQLAERHTFDGFVGTADEYLAQRGRIYRSRVLVMSADEFACARSQADVIYTIATFDVVRRVARRTMIEAAHRNLASKGLYVAIVPRNDSSILCRCSDANSYEDGFVFPRAQGCTFYANMRDHRPLRKMVCDMGFECVADKSVFRQVCLVFQRAN